MTPPSNTALALDPAAEPLTTLPPNDAPGRTLLFRHGLFGFPECRHFSLNRAQRDGFYWLRSTEHEPLRFLLVDPFVFFDDYTVDLAEGDVAHLQPSATADIAILATVTLPAARDLPPTANLQGPIAINMRSGDARQVIVNDPSCGVRHPILLHEK